MAHTGRKNFGEELQILRRYSDLSDPFFNFLKAKITEGTDQEKWEAVKVLKGAYEKMIPQDLTTGGNPISILYDGLFKTASSTGENSEQPSEVQGD